MVNFKEWWKYDHKEIISQVYWLRGQLPPSDKAEYDKSLNIILDELAKRYPKDSNVQR